jgi:hypothetical protein
MFTWGSDSAYRMSAAHAPFLGIVEGPIDALAHSIEMIQSLPEMKIGEVV